MKGRWEIVHTGPYKFHARWVSPNNEIVWTTESYRRRRDAEAAIWLLNDFYGSLGGVLLDYVEESEAES